MPLGKLSKAQIAKGLEALLDIEEAMKEKKVTMNARSHYNVCYTFGWFTKLILMKNVYFNIIYDAV